MVLSQVGLLTLRLDALGLRDAKFVTRVMQTVDKARAPLLRTLACIWRRSALSLRDSSSSKTHFKMSGVAGGGFAL